MAFPNLHASGIDAGDSFTPTNIFAGSTPPRTTQMTVKRNQTIAQFTVLALDDSGYLVPLSQTDTVNAVDSGTDTVAIPGPERKAVAISAYAIETASGAESVHSVYVEGDFNHEALVWPAATDTFAERVAAFAGTPITVRKLI